VAVFAEPDWATLVVDFGGKVGIPRRLQARKLTPVRTTNGATPRSSLVPTTPWLVSQTGEGFAFDAYEESRSSSPPWCRRRPALLEDDEGSLSRGQEEKLYDYYGISYDATERGAAWTPAEDLGPRWAPRPPADTLTDRTTRPRRPGGDDWGGVNADAISRWP
jgi:hypothetical protein